MTIGNHSAQDYRLYHPRKSNLRYLQRPYYVASVLTHLFFIFMYRARLRALELSVYGTHFYYSSRTYRAWFIVLFFCLSVPLPTGYGPILSIISTVFRQRRTASPRSTSWKADAHSPHYQSHTWDPSSFGTIVRDIVPTLPTDAARFPAQ